MMKLHIHRLRLPLICFALSGLVYSASGCGIVQGISSATERIGETRFVSKLTGRAKKDAIVKQKYQEMINPKSQVAQNQSGHQETRTTLPQTPDSSTTSNQTIQQASFESPANNQNNLAAAQKALIQKNYPEAARLYKEVLKSDPSNQMAHHRLAIISDNLNDFTVAEFHYMTALLSKPNDPNLLSDLGYSYLLQGKYHQSEEFLKKALMADPAHVRALDNLGYLYGKQARFDLALQYFRKTGSETEAQRKLNKVRTELASQQTQPVTHLPQQNQPLPQQQYQNYPQENTVMEIPAGPLPDSWQNQQVTPAGIQAPNPYRTTELQAQTGMNHVPAPPNTQGYQGNAIQQGPITQIGTLPPEGSVNTFAESQPVEQFRGGSRVYSGEVTPDGTTHTPQDSNSEHDLSPDASWPPADVQIPQTNKELQTTNHHQLQQQSQNMNQAIYSYPQGQEPNQVSNIPTQVQNQSLKQIHNTAAVMGMNTGPGGMFPVLQQRNLNQAQSQTQQPSAMAQQYPVSSQQYPQQYQQTDQQQFQQQYPQQYQQQLPSGSVNPNQSWSPNGTPQNYPNGNQQIPQQYQQHNFSHPQSQYLQGYPQSQTGTAQQQMTNSYSSGHPGTQLSSGNHLMNQSPIQIFEQEYFEEMEKARAAQTQLPEGTKTWVQQ